MFRHGLWKGKVSAAKVDGSSKSPQRTFQLQRYNFETELVSVMLADTDRVDTPTMAGGYPSI